MLMTTTAPSQTTVRKAAITTYCNTFGKRAALFTWCKRERKKSSACFLFLQFLLTKGVFILLELLLDEEIFLDKY